MTTSMNSKSLKYPFTINCKSCNIPVGDSFSLLDYKNNYLILNSVASTCIIDKKKINEEDSIYAAVKCKCLKVIGKMYISTNVEYNGYSGKYFISKEEVYSYVLGSNDKGVEVCLSDICEEIDKIQKMCVYLYKKIENNK